MLISFCAKAQKESWKVNRDSILQQVSDSSKATYYPKLFKRFIAFDTTLTQSEYRLLYYGYVTNEKYSAYTDIKTKEISEALDNKDFASASIISDSALFEAPVNLRANYYKALSLYLLDSTNLPYWKYSQRYTKLLQAILESGDGLTCNTAIKVIYVSDEYEICYRHLLIENVSSQSLNYPCDKLSIKPNDYFNSAEIYFDISESFFQMKKMFGEEKEPKKKRKE